MGPSGDGWLDSDDCGSRFAGHDIRVLTPRRVEDGVHPHRATCLGGSRELARLTRAPSRVGEEVRRSRVQAERRLRSGFNARALR